MTRSARLARVKLLPANTRRAICTAMAAVAINWWPWVMVMAGTPAKHAQAAPHAADRRRRVRGETVFSMRAFIRV